MRRYSARKKAAYDLDHKDEIEKKRIERVDKKVKATRKPTTRPYDPVRDPARQRDYLRRNREKVRARRRRHYEQNKEKINARKREWWTQKKQLIAEQRKVKRQTNPKVREQQRSYRERNKEKVSVWTKARYRRNRESSLAKYREYRKKHQEKINLSQRLKGKRSRDSLSARYVRHVIAQSVPVRLKEVPVELIELKRAHLLVSRKLKELKK